MKSNVTIAAALIVVLVIIVLSGFAMLRLLFSAWRRYDNAQRAASPSRRRIMPDIWQAGGDRLVSRMEQQREFGAGDARGGDEGDGDSDSADQEPPPASR